MVYALVEVSLHYFSFFFKQLYSTADSLVKNYIYPWFCKKSPPIRTSKQSNCAKSITPYTLELLKCVSTVFAYFAINNINCSYVHNQFIFNRIVILNASCNCSYFPHWVLSLIKLTFLYLYLFVWFYKYFF